MGNFRQCGFFRIREKQAAFDLCPEDTVLCGQIFIPQLQFLVHGPSDVRQHARPEHLPSFALWWELGFYVALEFEERMCAWKTEIFLNRGQSSTSA
jgi:hypothetical protein